MRSKIITAPGVAALLLALVIPIRVTSAQQGQAQTQAPAQKAEQDQKAAHERPGREEHPSIEMAIADLQKTRTLLVEHASNDFGGQKVIAIKHIDQAIEELRQALTYDKK